MLKKFNNLFTFVQSVVRSNSDAVAVEECSAPLVGLQSRLSRHLKTCSAAALLTAGSLMDADAAVVHWNNANLVIPATIDGLYINVETQATGSAGSVVAGWDINPYSATSLTWFNATGTGMCRYPGVTTGSAGNLASGTLVNASRSFGSGAVVVGSSPGNWQLNADNYFGFRFLASDGLTHYGWGRMTVGTAITVRTIAEIAYESVAGVEIAVGALTNAPACTAPTLSGLVTNAGCSGATNGGVNLTATGGSPSPLSYLWSNGATTEDLNNVGPGTYSVTVTAGTCSTTSTFTVGVASQPAQPSLACYETATFNNTTCQWDVTGTQPQQPTLACYETATFNTTTCQWDVTGTQPQQPSLACYESASFNTTTCQWDVTGTQPAQPSLACYETATFNNTTCQWDVTGTQPTQPSGLACYESASFNSTSCQWDVTGTQPTQPSGLACYQSAAFNSSTCSWDVSGSQPTQPSGLACYESASFNNTTCQWDVTGTQPQQPTLACYESATFNTTTCQWDVTGTQPAQPSLACYQSATFNTSNCQWELTNAIPIDTVTSCSSVTWLANGQTYNTSGTYFVIPTQTSGAYTSLSSFSAAVGAAAHSFGNTIDFENQAESGVTNGINWSASASGGMYFCNTPTFSLSTNNPAPLTLNFNSGVAAIGGNFFLTDINCSVVSGSLNIGLSDGTTYTLATSSASDFLGFVSGGSLITSITLTPPSSDYVTVDNLVFATGTPPSLCPTAALVLTINNCASVAGTVTYSNSGSTPMANAVVVLNQSGSEVGRDTTDASGSYSISSLTSGTYDVQVIPNTPWGGVNATDAVLIINHYTNRVLLNGIKLIAADVNGSQALNATDALNIMQRFTGALTAFPVGNYAAGIASYTASGTGTGTLNVSMLCYGDVNGSYQPTGGFVRTSWRSLDHQGVLRVGATGSYEVPLYASRQVQPGAVSLELALPEGVRLLGVRASEALDAQQVVYHQQGNRVRIAWIDESGAELRTGEALAYLMVEGDARGVWRSSSEVELANVLGEVQAGVELRMPKLTQGFEALAVSIYPNPGQGMRTLEMSLGESMRVVVRVTDALGRVVYAREGLQYGTGTHKLELNMEGWPAGSYQVQVLGETADDKYEQRNLTILQTR